MGEKASSKAWYKRWWLWAIIVIVIVGLTQVGGKKATTEGETDGTSTGTPTTSGSTTAAPAEQPTTPPMAVTATEYFEAYDGNEITADTKYKGKRLAITGTVKDVEKTFGSIYANLEGNEFLGQVSCKLESEADAAKLTKGQSVTLVGTGDGKVGFPRVTDCVLK